MNIVTIAIAYAGFLSARQLRGSEISLLFSRIKTIIGDLNSPSSQDMLRILNNPSIESSDLLHFNDIYSETVDSNGEIEKIAITICEVAKTILSSVNDVGKLGTIFYNAGLYEHAILCYTAALEQSIVDKKAQSPWFGGIGNAYRELGKYQIAQQNYELAIEKAKEVDDNESAFWMSELGSLYGMQAQYQISGEFYKKALDIFSTNGNLKGLMIVQGNLGNISREQGSLETAEKYFEEARVIAKMIPAPREEGISLGNLGNIYFQRGDYKKSLAYYLEAVNISQQVGDPLNIATWVGSIGNIYFSNGQFHEANEYYFKALSISRSSGNIRTEVTWLNNLGFTNLNLKNYTEALKYFGEALSAAQNLKDVFEETTLHGCIGNVYYEMGQYEKSLNSYKAGLAVAKANNLPEKSGMWLASIGLVYRQLDDIKNAKVFLQQAIIELENIDLEKTKTIKMWLSDLQKNSEK